MLDFQYAELVGLLIAIPAVLASIIITKLYFQAIQNHKCIERIEKKLDQHFDFFKDWVQRLEDEAKNNNKRR